MVARSSGGLHPAGGSPIFAELMRFLENYTSDRFFFLAAFCGITKSTKYIRKGKLQEFISSL